MHSDYTYIVTGCTGFVGNVLTKRLISDGLKVVGFARSEKKVKQVFGDNAPQMIYGDVTKKEDVDRLFENADSNTVVIHTVAKVSIGESSNEEMQSITVDGTSNVVSCCINKKVKKLLHITSTEALPRNKTLLENAKQYIPDPNNTTNGYARTKSLADKIVLDAVENNGLDASLLMLASVIGPGDYTKGHMSQMFIDYIEGRLPASIDGGYNDFDIRDVADVLPNIVDKSVAGENYIFANKPNKINNMLNIIANKLNKKKLITLPIWMAYAGLPFLTLWAKMTKKRPLYTKVALSTLKEDADFPLEKTIETFGYTPRPLEQTVSDQVDFFIENNMVKL